MHEPPSKMFALCLDAFLVALFLVLRTPHLSGLAWHEWLGILFCVPLLVHLLLSWRWIRTALRRALSPARRRDTVNMILNVLLFVSTTGVVISGLMISQIALPWVGVITVDDVVWRTTHNNWSDFMLVTLSAHIAMNFRWIVTVANPYLPAWLKEVL